MQVNVKKWGNRASVPIPATVMTAAKLRIDWAVEVRQKGRVTAMSTASGYTLEPAGLLSRQSNPFLLPLH